MSKDTPVKLKKGARKASKNSTPVSTPSKKKSASASKDKAQKRATAEKAPKDKALIPTNRLENAVTQLYKFMDSKPESANTLIDDDELSRQMQLIVTSSKSYTGSQKSFKPLLLNVKHSIFAPWKKASATSIKDFKILLILKDQDKDKVSEDDLYELLEKPHAIKIDEVIDGSSLKTKYKAFEKRRALLAEYSLVLADDSIVTTLPKLLGGKAYKKISTTPIPIRTGKAGTFSKTSLVNAIVKIYNEKLPILLPRGNTVNVHLGHASWFESSQFVENIATIAEQLTKAHPIRSIYLKSNDSPVLPLYYNTQVIEAAASAFQKLASASTPAEKITIDGIEVDLSTFDRALLEVANPDTISSLFSNQINKAKRKLAENDAVSASTVTKKAKN
ncbi:HBL217Wp [Eremothecium sinecaudum]|uniref:HBL217Wp n=1 Tax=Eremothecium sinecaudum TaxID=45286 RepID=A0A125RDV4_9SACH|nr:HBL217Wp [Eremothecium sinecaudum]AMD18685.1 HBL217Wp [Eremothecium sinecaudum]